MSTEAIIRPKNGDDPSVGMKTVQTARLSCTCNSCSDLSGQVGFFLNDVLQDNAGNLVVIPKSHLLPHGPPPDLPQGSLAPGAIQVKVKAGTAIVFHSALWHCVQAINVTVQGTTCITVIVFLGWLLSIDMQVLKL